VQTNFIDEYQQGASPHFELLTDLYELTMAQGYWEEGKAELQACFYVFFRDNPFGGAYSLACGIAQVLDLIEDFEFTSDDIAYLATLPAPGGGLLFKREFLDYLAQLRLSLDVDSVVEGDIVFPREPLVRVTGPILQCQIVEAALLNCVGFQTLVATKASRVCTAAKGRPVAEFGLRRAQGPDGGNSASRAAYIGGCASTSNVLAGRLYDIPVSGTHAHSWVLAFDDELSAFRAFAHSAPNNCVLLIDTYNVEQGTEHAITVAREMERRGQRLSGVRIDSGDLAWLSKKVRTRLDEAGLDYVKIVLSNDLDEQTINSLDQQGACVDSFGVGTYLATSFDQPALGCVYKLSALQDPATGVWEPKMKATEQLAKATIPGVLGVRRYFHEDGTICGDMIYDTSRPIGPGREFIIDPLDLTRHKDLTGRSHRELLRPLVRDGKPVVERESATSARERAMANVASLDPSMKRLLRPHTYPAGIEEGLWHRREDFILAVRGE